MNRIVIIGGSDAGISAGLRIKEINPESDVTIILKDEYPNFSICGLPFYIGGEISDWRNLAHRNMDQLLETGMRFMLHYEVTDIDYKRHRVRAVNQSGQDVHIFYDKLIFATGAVSVRPPIPGADLPGVFFMRFMDDGLAIKDYIHTHHPKRVTIIGTGYIGMEMAEAMHRQGLSVRLIEMVSSVMPSLDKEIGDCLKEVLADRGMSVLTGTTVNRIERRGHALAVHSDNEKLTEADIIIVAAGATPSVDLAMKTGLQLGVTGAMAVNEKMETSMPDIYAAGDCVETYHRIIDQYVYMPLGTTAHKQGRIAGENAAGGNSTFKGIVGTQSLKCFDRVVARTGLRHGEASDHGFLPMTIELETPDHKAYYPGATPINIRLTGDRKTGRLLGAQMIGYQGAEVSKRIDIIAAALFSDLQIADLADLDLSYTPPLSSPWDPVQMAAFKWLTHHNS